MTNTTEPWLAALMEKASASCTADALSQGILTLGGLRTALKLLPADLPLALDTGQAPSNLHSYRGYYERLSIGWERPRDDWTTEHWRHAAHPDYDPDPALQAVHIAEPVTVGEFLKALDLADGEKFEGYKGGQYVMGPGTFMHVAEYGDTGRYVSGLRMEGDSVVIETDEEDWKKGL